MITERLDIADAYARECEATVVAVNERGGVLLDRSIFYPAGGGQPGDSGRLIGADGAEVAVATTVHGDTRGEVVHVAADPAPRPRQGEVVRCLIDWPRRHAHMRIHTALHLLSVLLPYPVTGGQIASDGGRLDFDIPAAGIADKDELTARLAELIAADHPVRNEWISDEELAAKPELVKTMAVKPPMGSGRVRLVRIGQDVDLQPCGGTHVKSTAEIGAVAVSKIEKKGRQNRRVRIAFV